MHEEPRAWALHPDAFGRTSEIEWTELESAADVMPLAAAKLQHRWVLAVRGAMRDQSLTRKATAFRMGMKYARFGRLMRGEIALQVPDIALAQVVLSIQVDFQSEHSA